ncbi:uncharacterized protein [Prorops nasuta]|uniref:uncharacterized protein n=1 Tax=Prorops nasuta TaxID=863751 RepID=UPI0034CFBCB8
MLPVIRPELKICNTDKLHITRRPSCITWILLGIFLLILLDISYRVTNNALTFTIIILGEITFVLEILGETEDLILDKTKNIALLYKKCWCNILCSEKSTIVMNLSDIQYVGISAKMGLFILHRQGRTFYLNMEGLAREDIQILRKTIEAFLKTSNAIYDIFDRGDPTFYSPKLERKYLRNVSYDQLLHSKMYRRPQQYLSLPILSTKMF